MRDLNRKVEKFVKEKNVASAKKARDSALAPHVIYGVSSGPKTSAKINKNLTTRSFSMTVSFFNPKFEKNYPKDFAIRHEDKQAGIIAAAPETTSPRRNPIVQDNNEAVQEFKSTIKCTPLSAKTTIFTEEPAYSRKVAGEYNHVYNARSVSPKVEGIRTQIPTRRDNSPEEFRRQKKTVKSPHMKSFNPIVDGDISGIKTVKQRTAPEISEATKKINDRNNLLAADLGNSGRGKIFRDTNVTLNSDRTDLDSQRSHLGARLGSPKSKPKDSIQGLMEYNYAPSFRDQGVADKCNNQTISNVIKATVQTISEAN